jgi:hypothetical protein
METVYFKQKHLSLGTKMTCWSVLDQQVEEVSNHCNRVRHSFLLDVLQGIQRYRNEDNDPRENEL